MGAALVQIVEGLLNPRIIQSVVINVGKFLAQNAPTVFVIILIIVILFLLLRSARP